MAAAPADIDLQLARRIRDLRARRSLTLDALAERSEVSRGMLSRIERGESSPTAQLLNKVCGGLGITIGTLFAEAGATASTPLARRDDQPTWRDPASGYLRRRVSPPGTDAPLDLTEVEFPAGARVGFEPQALPGATQHVWLIEGQMTITLGEELYALEAGDCLVTRFDRPIVFHNPGLRPARYAVILSQPNRTGASSS